MTQFIKPSLVRKHEVICNFLLLPSTLLGCRHAGCYLNTCPLALEKMLVVISLFDAPAVREALATRERTGPTRSLPSGTLQVTVFQGPFLHLPTVPARHILQGLGHMCLSGLPLAPW